MMPNQHNPLVGIPISLELIRECFSEINALLCLVKSALANLVKRPQKEKPQAQERSPFSRSNAPIQTASSPCNGIGGSRR
jgi:hypothetical protein